MSFTVCPTIHRKLPTFSRNLRAAGFAILVFALALPAAAQTAGRGTSQKSVPAPQPTESDPRSTPRGTITGFIRAVDRDDFVSAARYMQLNDKQKPKTEELCRDLRELLNHYFHAPLGRSAIHPPGTQAMVYPSTATDCRSRSRASEST
ncbi:MAG TPA: hypothetical protein VEI52_08480 [Terriglobales bacterium]|nr:hypothetical protein [Terriglobales bacterium]